MKTSTVAYSDFDGISDAFFGSKNQQLFRQRGGRCSKGSSSVRCRAAIDVERLVNESASVQIDKEDYSVYTSQVYKFGGGQ